MLLTLRINSRFNPFLQTLVVAAGREINNSEGLELIIPSPHTRLRINAAEVYW